MENPGSDTKPMHQAFFRKEVTVQKRLTPHCIFQRLCPQKLRQKAKFVR